MYRTAIMLEKDNPRDKYNPPLLDRFGASTCPGCGKKEERSYCSPGVSPGRYCGPCRRVRVTWWFRRCSLPGHHLHQFCDICKCRWAVKVKSESLEQAL